MGPYRWGDHEQAYCYRPQGLQHRWPALNHFFGRKMMVYENKHTLHIGPWWRSIALSSRRTECRLIKFTGLWMLLQVSFHTSSCRKTKFVVHICCLSLFPSYALFHYAFCVCQTSSQYIQMWQRSVIRGCKFISCWPDRHNRKNNGHEVIFGQVSRFAETRAESQIMIHMDHAKISWWCFVMSSRYHDIDHAAQTIMLIFPAFCIFILLWARCVVLSARNPSISTTYMAFGISHQNAQFFFRSEPCPLKVHEISTLSGQFSNSESHCAFQ